MTLNLGISFKVIWNAELCLSAELSLSFTVYHNAVSLVCNLVLDTCNINL